ncbi:hypothetical protein [Comamonas aquatica]|uniref:hypothetical protein n=1 Tax=Comamonas aquatica TaxID=225991 RepID=UPI0021B0E2A4|nr:hypothetical protein [Comamonas aquatica]
MLTSFQAWAHALAPVYSVAFEALAWLSLACYLLFAVVALHYALRPWAEKAMLAAIGGGTAASLVLHLSLRSSPDYVGEGPLWKFVSVSQYLPWVVVSVGGLYVLYRIGLQLRKMCCGRQDR